MATIKTLKEEDNNLLIPTVFHNHDTGALFDRCIDCNRYLLDGSIEYFIEKALKTYQGYTAKDVIFEYAICINCAEQIRKRMSEESMRNIQLYFAENTNLSERISLINNHPNDPTAWMNQCLIKGTAMNELQEYQLYAHCRGDQLITTQMPYMISMQALDEIADLLSNQTLDELDDFMNRHFGPPPELMEPLPGRRKVILV